MPVLTQPRMKDCDSFAEYFSRLKEKGNVIADHAEREDMILKQAGQIEKKVWNGKNNRGYTISNGCYILKIATDKQVLTKSFVLSR